MHLVGAVLADLYDDWIATERRYLSEHWIARLYPEREDAIEDTADLEPGDSSDRRGEAGERL